MDQKSNEVKRPPQSRDRKRGNSLTDIIKASAPTLILIMVKERHRLATEIEKFAKLPHEEERKLVHDVNKREIDRLDKIIEQLVKEC